MIDLGSFVSAMKITWKHKLYNNLEAPWVKVVKLYLGLIKLFYSGLAVVKTWVENQKIILV